MSADDDLSAPLGLEHKRRRLRLSVGPVLAALLGLFIAVFVVWAAVVNDPLGGEPVAIVSTEPAKPAPPAEEASAPGAVMANADQAKTEPAKPTPAAGGDNGGVQTVTIIDGTSGKRQEVAIASEVRAAPIEPKLLETSRHGPIPRVGLDGARASVAYARPADATVGAKIAVVVGGLGIGASATGEALAKLPAAVTFAFAPYAADLERLVARARGDGHEVLLQLPMEPFDYPDNDPGPQTLLTSLGGEQNIDRMHWLMSRFQGYVGVASYMGGRFTATEAAFAPVLREVAKRGLIYFDDGSSPRSLAGQIAGANNLPFAKANVIIDAAPAADEIDRALALLEHTARTGGFAVGATSALPIAIERLSKWAKTAAERGFTLVPITAAAVKAKSS